MSELKVNKIKPFFLENVYVLSGSLAGTSTSASYVDIDDVQRKEIYFPPFIKSVSPSNILTTGSQTIEISGSNFDTEAIAYFKGITGVRQNPTTSTRNSNTKITVVYSGSGLLTSSLDPYDVYVQNGSGLTSYKKQVVTVNRTPDWVTESGQLGIIYASSSLSQSFFVSASDPDGDTVSYTLVSGSLPDGLTFITSSGEITGSSLITEDTGSYNQSGVNYNFTVQATDGLTLTSRSFYITKKWLDGSTEQQAAPSALYIKNSIGINTNGNYWIKPPGQSAYEIYCDMTNQSGGWMLVAVGREGTSTETGNRDWWRDGGDTAGAYVTGLKQVNLPESGNTNPRYMPVSWIQAACGGNTWNEIEMICNRTELGDSLYYRNASNNFAWSNFESSPAAFNLTISRHTGQWLGGTTTYTYTGNYWTDTNSAGVAGNNAERIFTWTWDGHSAGGVQYTGWSAGSSVSAPPGFEAGTENHAIQFVNVFVR